MASRSRNSAQSSIYGNSRQLIESQIATRLTETSFIDENYIGTTQHSPLGMSVMSSIALPKKPLSFFQKRKENMSFEISDKSGGFKMMQKVILTLKEQIKSNLTPELRMQNEINEGIKFWLTKKGDMDLPEASLINEDIRGKLA